MSLYLICFQNKSFTCTLFMPFENFDAIKTESDLMEFFKRYFPDSIPLIGEERLKEEFFRNPKGTLMSIKVVHFVFYVIHFDFGCESLKVTFCFISFLVIR